MKTTTLLAEIAAFIFGRKYYANTIVVKGIAKTEICSRIFRTRKEAEEHRRALDGTRSFVWLETISFRSRKEY